MRLIDADARIDDLTERYCKECYKRKGMKKGKWQFIYEIGDAPCRACEVGDAKEEFEDAPTIDAVPVVRCKDCKYWDKTWRNDWSPDYHYCPMTDGVRKGIFYCAYAERSEG